MFLTDFNCTVETYAYYLPYNRSQFEMVHVQ